MISIDHIVSPLEIISTFVSIITFVMFAILFFLALSDQRIVVGVSPDRLDRIIASNAVMNEILRWLIGTAMLIIWVSSLLTTAPRDPTQSYGSPSIVGLALLTMIPFIQVVLMGWGVKDLILRRRMLHSDHVGNSEHNPILIPPDFPPGDPPGGVL